MENKQQDNKKKRKIGLLVGLVAGIPAAVATATTLAVVIPSLMPKVEDKDVEVGQTEWFEDFEKKETAILATYNTFEPADVKITIDGVELETLVVENSVFYNKISGFKGKTVTAYEDGQSFVDLWIDSNTLKNYVGMGTPKYIENKATGVQKLEIYNTNAEINKYFIFDSSGYITECLLYGELYKMEYINPPHLVTNYTAYLDKLGGETIRYMICEQLCKNENYTFTANVKQADEIRTLYCSGFNGNIDTSTAKIYLGDNDDTANWTYYANSKVWYRTSAAVPSDAKLQFKFTPTSNEEKFAFVADGKYI